MITADYCSACERIAPTEECEVHGAGTACAWCGKCELCDMEWFDSDERDYDHE